jgi:hypothetical protein
VWRVLLSISVGGVKRELSIQALMQATNICASIIDDLNLWTEKPCMGYSLRLPLNN